jgi:Domain of unknown function (DUF4149)
MQGVLRLLQLLSMVVWAGGLIFFAFVLAPTAFHTLPTVHLAGAMVGASLKVFDVLALVCGFVFLGVTALMFRGAAIRIRGRYEMEFLLAGVMVLGTAYIHWNVIPAMDADMAQVGGDIDKVEITNPTRMHFEKLHVRSERVESVVLLLSLGVLFLMSREQLAVED